jgi:hypothetical protein
VGTVAGAEEATVDAIQDLVDARGFGDGIVAGAVAFAIVLAITWLTGRRRADLAGLGFAGAGLAALSGAGPLRGAPDVPGTLWLAIGLLSLGGFALRHPRVPGGAAVVMYAPGAIVLGYATDPRGEFGPSWVPAALAAATAIAGALTYDTDRARARDAIGPVLLFVSVAGIYTTVPDTEHAVVLVGAALPLVAFAVPTGIGSLGPEGAGAAIGLTLWMSAIDGQGRHGAIVGAFGCLGLLLTDPIGRRLAARGSASPARLPGRHSRYEHLIVVALFVILQVAITAFAARVAGTEGRVGTALAYLAPALVAAVLVSVGLPPPARSRRARAPA